MVDSGVISARCASAGPGAAASAPAPSRDSRLLN